MHDVEGQSLALSLSQPQPCKAMAMQERSPTSVARAIPAIAQAHGPKPKIELDTT
eukprot:CAMPEP_0204583798 /NCGR_PEP_ID=MMETSP0661-20131031/45980_1 /ASSEMBLY_ACC=CAM_ASM_000606 /TAXON_ID=109239 /ORGANISM="Alexandrium margalefi, Strain AMGDE01CS-322" /LENGTH=54 /DNA_ID=CAMNT_0051593189 /DNA_START=192 /DNA_END=352 /DNA_ORIENTATION=-